MPQLQPSMLARPSVTKHQILPQSFNPEPNSQTFNARPASSRPGRAGATLPALLKILHYIKRAEDSTAAPATPALHLLCDVGLAIAPEIVRLLDSHADLGQVFPGNVPLPSALFRPLQGSGEPRSCWPVRGGLGGVCLVMHDWQAEAH